VFVGIVEREAPPGLPPQLFDPHEVQGTAVRDLEAEVEDRARVGDAAVGQDVGAGPHDREADLGAMVADVVEREIGEHGGDLGARGVVGIVALSIGIEEVGVPRAPGRQAAALRLRHVVVERLHAIAVHDGA